MSSAFENIRESFREEHGEYATGLGIREDLISYHRENYDAVWDFIEEEMTVLGGRSPNQYDEHIQIYALDEELANQKLEEMIERNEQTASEHLETFQQVQDTYRGFEKLLEETGAPTFSSDPDAKSDFTQDVYERVFHTVLEELDVEIREVPDIDVRPETGRTEANYCEDSGEYFIALSEEQPENERPESYRDLFAGDPPVPELPVMAVHEAGHVVANLLGDSILDERGEEYPVRSVKNNNDINSEKAANEVAKLALESEGFTLSDYGIPDEELAEAHEAYLEMTKWHPFDYQKQHPVTGEPETVEKMLSKV